MEERFPNVAVFWKKASPANRVVIQTASQIAGYLSGSAGSNRLRRRRAKDILWMANVVAIDEEKHGSLRWYFLHRLERYLKKNPDATPLDVLVEFFPV